MKKTVVYQGVGFPGLLTLLLIALKLTGYIALSWWWVLICIWLPIAALVVFVLVILILVLIEEAVLKWKRAQVQKARAKRAKELLDKAGGLRPLGD